MTRPHRHLLPDGRICSTADLAREYGVPYNTMLAAITRHGLATVLAKPPRPKRHFTMPDGRQLTQRQAARELGISDAGLYKRTQRQWEPERILAPGRQPSHSPDTSKLTWCQVHNTVLTRTYTGWTWEPILPGLFDRAREYAQQFGYTLQIIQKACPQCAQRKAA